MCGIESMTDFLHMFAMLSYAKMRSGLLAFFHLALLNDFGSLVSWMCVKLHESAHCSTASPSLYVLAYPHIVLWLFKSPITIYGGFLRPRDGSSNRSFGGLYTECTTAPDITIVMISTVPWTLS